MILYLEEAKKLLKIKDDSQDFELELKLKALETMIRNKTNNKFLDTRVRASKHLFFNDGNTITGANFKSLGFRNGNTIDIDDSIQNNGIYEVLEVSETYIKVKEDIQEEECNCLITKVLYPADIKLGVIKILQYDNKMADKIGIKKETIARMSTEYFDMGNDESVEGYPVALLKFLDKYKKLRWS
ncbi:hypothetical protein Z965_11230 [Clostridium novyi A str. BKT29909]|uniref:Uncharacterized protein n=1 Tax=Clostridium haemolyticum NCTC 9693 TaxID=1443114 RepID=A0ABR4TCU0_CLOHA|nr:MULTISPECIES: phage head-tail connector protein [Clostridium]KEH84946.1 hypothetical protein Z965_11230 [Clostridium novyi A str. BKT29909]KEH89557.1 hypothetical protein Z967_08185 [Clostridium novyi A str. 4540]KEI15457.1 hypothetical protein Z960_00520 [Clostridium haemolyticum NCTC 9693]